MQLLSTWSFSARGNEVGWSVLERGGSGLDAVEACCREVESAPDVDSVGYGGLPDAAGRMSLDGCVMLSPARSGSACALRRHRHPVSVARRVMERTPHIMLVGSDADDFADAQGFPAEELLSPEARAAWERWRAAPPAAVDQRLDRSLAARPIDGGAPGDGRLFASSEARWKHHDTIGTLCIDRAGGLVGACSTSGTPFKLPGRVGDSPIIGHGLYVDPEAGAASATGSGELVMGVCGSFLAVEFLRLGRSPLEAALLVIERIRHSFDIAAHHQVAMLVMRADGAWASAALKPGFLAAARDASGARLVPPGAVAIPSA